MLGSVFGSNYFSDTISSLFSKTFAFILAINGILRKL